MGLNDLYDGYGALYCYTMQCDGNFDDWSLFKTYDKYYVFRNIQDQSFLIIDSEGNQCLDSNIKNCMNNDWVGYRQECIRKREPGKQTPPDHDEHCEFCLSLQIPFN